MPYGLVDSIARHSGAAGIATTCQLPLQVPEIWDEVAGRNASGYIDPEPERSASRRFELSGVTYEMSGQESAAAATPEEALLKASGFVRSGTIGTGLTYTVGDPHASADTPAGDLVRLPYYAVWFENRKFTGIDLVADCTMSWIAGQVPFYTFNFSGLIGGEVGDAFPTSGTAVPARTETSELVQSQPALTARTSYGLSWQNSTIVASGGLTLVTTAIRSITVALNNRIVLRPAGSGAFGYAAPNVNARRVTCTVLVEKGNSNVNENSWITGTQGTLAWSYVAGGASLNTLTQTFVGKIRQRPAIQDENGNWLIPLVLTQDPTGAAFKMVTT